jgi:N6-adenosine-specific RNA methylase IME4
MTGELTRYDDLCRAVAEAKSVDEAIDLANKADALRVYYRKAKNRQLEIDAGEIRIRAERRLGELLAEGKEKGWFGEGRPPENCNPDEQFPRVSLSEIGIDRPLSARAQAVARLPREEFERDMGRWREDVAKVGARVTTNLLREREKAARRDEFRGRVADGCSVEDLGKLIDARHTFGTIYADPPWLYKTWSEKGEDRAPEYRRDPLKAMAEMPVAKLAADDCVLLMWAIGPMLREALDLIDAWGFDLKTMGFVWMKTNADGSLFMGNGYWTRANAEICLLATRGKPLRLDMGVPMAVLAPRGEHSAKPEEIHERIERLVGGPYLELYARKERPGWTTWGNEIARVSFEAELACAAPADLEGARGEDDSSNLSSDCDHPRPEAVHTAYAADRSRKWNGDIGARVAELYETEHLSLRQIGEQLGFGHGESKGIYRRFKEKRLRDSRTGEAA